MEELRILQDVINGNLEEFFLGKSMEESMDAILENFKLHWKILQFLEGNGTCNKSRFNSWRYLKRNSCENVRKKPQIKLLKSNMWKKATANQTVILVVMSLGISKKS